MHVFNEKWNPDGDLIEEQILGEPFHPSIFSILISRLTYSLTAWMMAYWNLDGAYTHFDTPTVVVGDDGTTRYRFVCKK